ncbi:MAG: hypothetical protein AB7F86_19745 [Bdellovibrionales bacterium]
MNRFSVLMLSLLFVMLQFAPAFGQALNPISPQNQMEAALDLVERSLVKGARTESRLVDDILNKDLRYSVFELEELTLTYSKISQGKDEIRMLEAQKVTRALENAIGSYAFYVEVVEFFEKEMKAWSESLKLSKKELTQIALLQQKAIHQRDEEKLKFIDWLSLNGWLNGERVGELKKVAAKFGWPKKKKDAELVRGFVAKKLNQIRERLAKNEYDPHQVESGIHELRRDLRRIIMQFQFMPGLVKLTEGPLNDVLSEVLEGVTVSPKYLQLRTMKSRTPVAVLEQDFKAMIFFVKTLGKAKDNGQFQEQVEKLAQEAGLTETLSHALADKMIQSLPYPERDFVETSKATMTTIGRSAVLERLHAALSGCAKALQD